MSTLVVKIGTSTITSGGEVKEEFLARLAAQVHQLHLERHRVVIVTSGAIRMGLDLMGRERAVRLPEKQAAAAVGQTLLMRAYRVAFNARELHVAQLLLTRADVADKARFLNARHTMRQLLRWGVVPIVNENDTVATEEISIGENDTLAALTALVAEADQVVLLSDVEGFYLPGKRHHLERIEKITPEIEAAAGGAGSRGGTGGMRTKVDAARIAMQAGIDLVIANGQEPEALLRLARGEALGTRFVAAGRLRGRKRWIRFGRAAQGTLLVHDRARDALVERGSSLLPVGILEVTGSFARGALVTVKDSVGEYAQGLTNYSSEELARIAGLHSSSIKSVLGSADFEEAIHRDNLALL